MSNIALSVVVVDRPLERDALIGTGSDVLRNRRREGFEIEIRRGWAERSKGVA